MFGLVGAILTIISHVVYIVINTGIISLVNEDWDYEKQKQVYTTFNVIMNILGLISASSLATFFYILHKNQKWWGAIKMLLYFYDRLTNVLNSPLILDFWLKVSGLILHPSFILHNHHNDNDKEDTDTKDEEEQKEPLHSVSEVDTLGLLVAVVCVLALSNEHFIDIIDVFLHLPQHSFVLRVKQVLYALHVGIGDMNGDL